MSYCFPKIESDNSNSDTSANDDFDPAKYMHIHYCHNKNIGIHNSLLRHKQCQLRRRLLLVYLSSCN